MAAKKPYDENSPEVQSGKIDFNKTEDLLNLIEQTKKETKITKELIGNLNEGIKTNNVAINLMMPFIKQMMARPKIAIGIILLIECLLYGIISQVYLMVKFIINLF